MKLLNEKEEPIIRSATTYVLSGDISEEDFERIKAYCINPVDSRETDETVPETLVQKFDEPADVKIFDGFKDMPEAELKKLYDSLGLAMTFKDFLNRTRISHAERLLLETNLPMSDVASLCGYESGNYFGDVFKKTKGISPIKFREAKGYIA